MAKNWSKDVNGNFEYAFNWMDENGCGCGGNQVWAKDMKTARKLAKKMESKPHWIHYDVIVDGKTIPSKEWYKGMLFNPKSIKRVTREQSAANDRMYYLLTC